MASLVKKDESEYSPETSAFWFEEDVTPDFHVKSECFIRETHVLGDLHANQRSINTGSEA